MALKIKREHYRHILGQFKTLTHQEVREVVNHAKSMELHPQLANRKVRQDLLRRRIGSKWIVDNLYPYMNDNHLDSALKKIANETGVPQFSSDSQLQSA